MDFLFFGERARGEREWEGTNVNWGFKRSASYQQVTSKLEGGGSMGDKSGIRRFYRRVWKNIFYEWGDKERKRGFWGRDGRVNLYFFKIF